MLNLPSRLAVATHTHRSRHGNNNTDTHCLTEDGIVAQKKKTKTKNKKQQTPNQKKGGGGVKNYKEMILKLGERERDRNCTITKQLAFLKTKFSEKT